MGRRLGYRLGYRIGLSFNISLLLLLLVLLGKQYPVAEYKGENGLLIKSYSMEWRDEEKLKSVYEEVVHNIHGEEMKYLKMVCLYPDKRGVAAYYYSDIQNMDGHYYIGKNARIELYNMDAYGSVDEYARIISHEYGHHFTTYYILKEEGLIYDDWEKSRYAKVRQLDHNELVSTWCGNSEEERGNHKWDLAEIAAEDYVQLLGSPTGKKTVYYEDVQQRLLEKKEQYSYSSLNYNLLPQENLDIPLAGDMPELYTYFYSMISTYPHEYPPLEIERTKLFMNQRNVVNMTQYFISWAPVSGVTEYTLAILREGEELPEPIKTLTPGDYMEAVLGAGITKDEGGKYLLMKQELDTYYRVFLFGKDEYGFMHVLADEKMTFIP